VVATYGSGLPRCLLIPGGINGQTAWTPVVDLLSNDCLSRSVAARGCSFATPRAASTSPPFLQLYFVWFDYPGWTYAIQSLAPITADAQLGGALLPASAVS
jgi:hypothetical protein